MKKFAVISVALPPTQSGQSMVLSHILKKTDPTDYCLISQKNFHLYHMVGTCSTRLPGRYFFLHPDYEIIRLVTGIADLLHLDFVFDLFLALRVRQIKKIIAREGVGVVVGCTSDLFNPAAAFLACRDLEIPFVFYAFDYYSQQWTKQRMRSFAERFEGEILRSALKTIVPNECMKREYYNRFGILPAVIHNTFDLREYEQNAGSSVTGAGSDNDEHEVRIVYTGAIYEAHYTAFLNLVAAIKKTGVKKMRLHIYSPQSQSQIQAHGITGPVVFHTSLPNQDIPKIQRNSDILFLPLAFNSGFPEVIRTSAPGKIGEYLASRTPIIVHAPAGSFVTWYFRRHSCGWVVDKNDPDVLAQAIGHLLRDKKLQQELSDNAYKRALEDFDVEIARKQFNDLIGMTRPCD